MGLFWDLMQQSAISENREKSETLECRVRDLELELSLTNRRLNEVIKRLEQFTGEDINKDGKVG